MTGQINHWNDTNVTAELTCCGATVLFEGGLQLRQAFQRRGWPDPFILVHSDCFSVAFIIYNSGCHRNDLGFKQAHLLSFCCSVREEYERLKYSKVQENECKGKQSVGEWTKVWHGKLVHHRWAVDGKTPNTYFHSWEDKLLKSTSQEICHWHYGHFTPKPGHGITRFWARSSFCSLQQLCDRPSSTSPQREAVHVQGCSHIATGRINASSYSNLNYDLWL